MITDKRCKSTTICWPPVPPSFASSPPQPSAPLGPLAASLPCAACARAFLLTAAAASLAWCYAFLRHDPRIFHVCLRYSLHHGDRKAGLSSGLRMGPCMRVVDARAILNCFVFLLEHCRKPKTPTHRLHFPLLSCLVQHINFTSFVDRHNKEGPKEQAWRLN